MIVYPGKMNESINQDAVWGGKYLSGMPQKTCIRWRSRSLQGKGTWLFGGCFVTLDI